MSLAENRYQTAPLTACGRLGDGLLKATGENIVGLESNRTHNVMLTRVEDSWQLGMLVEEIDAEHAAVVIPNVPSP